MLTLLVAAISFYLLLFLLPKVKNKGENEGLYGALGFLVFGISVVVIGVIEKGSNLAIILLLLMVISFFIGMILNDIVNDNRGLSMFNSIKKEALKNKLKRIDEVLSNFELPQSLKEQAEFRKGIINEEIEAIDTLKKADELKKAIRDITN